MKAVFKSPLGTILLLANRGRLVYCNWNEPECDVKFNKIKNAINDAGSKEDEKVIKDAMLQLSEYFSGHRKNFFLPLEMRGTDFQKKVWRMIATIGYGETKTYGELAEKCGNIRALRGVALACGANPLAIMVPCHRVVSKGNIGGYTGGVSKKLGLLSLEYGFKKPHL